MSRHKWNGKLKQGLTVACAKCGCVKVMIGNIATYFINDTSYDKAPPCEKQEPVTFEALRNLKIEPRPYNAGDRYE